MSKNGISDEFKSKLDTLLEKTENESENLLFIRDDFLAIEFCISPALNKEEGIILKKFQILIDRNGGEVKFNLSAGGHHIIKLVHNITASFISEDDLFLSQFVLDSVEANKLLNLCNYRATKTKFPDVNPNRIMRGLESWEDARRKRNSLEETTNVVIDSSESEHNMEERSSHSERPRKRRKQYYSIDEERDILNYIVKKRYYYRVKGNAIWKDMEKQKVCGYRTWQSMKERYLNHIIPKIGQFKLNPQREVKVLMLFRGNNNVKISHNGMERTTRDSNVERNREESKDDDDQESSSAEPSSDNVPKEIHGSENDNEESENEWLYSKSLSGANCGDNTLKNTYVELNERNKTASKQASKEFTSQKVPSVPNNLAPESSNNRETEELIRGTSKPETLCEHHTSFSEKPLTVKELQNMPNTSSPNTEEIEELFSLWCDAETSPGKSDLDSLPEISNTSHCFDASQEKSCKETQNNDSRATQEFEIQNNEECSGEKRNTEKFDPKFLNCVVNLGTKLNYSFQIQGLDHLEKPQRSGLKENIIKKSESVKDLNVSHKNGNQNINSSTETMIFQTSSVNERSKTSNLSENSNVEIPLQINRSKPSTSSKMESHSSYKDKRSINKSNIDEPNLEKRPKEQKMSRNASSNHLHNHSKLSDQKTIKTCSLSSSSCMSRDEIYTICSSDSEDDFTSKSRRVKNYTEDEDQMILNYIYIHNLYSSIGGKTMWEDLEEKNLLPGRSWHSLKERFRKRILPRLDKTKLNKEMIEKFKRCQNKTETKSKNPKKYSEEEDTLIVKYIIKYKRFKEIKGRSLWVNMSKWGPLRSRTWESLKNRFLKNIASDIESYDISNEAMESFKKALKRKRRPPNFKKYEIPVKSRTKKLPSRQCRSSTVDYTSLSDDDDSSGRQSSLATNNKNNYSDCVNESDISIPCSYETSFADDECENVKRTNVSKKDLFKRPFKVSESNSQQISQNPKQDKYIMKATDDCGKSLEQNSPEEVLLKRTVMKRKLYTKNLGENLYEKTPCNSGYKKDIFKRNEKLPENIHSQAGELVDNDLTSKEVRDPVDIDSQSNELVGDNRSSPSKKVQSPVKCQESKELVVDQRSPSNKVLNLANIHSRADEFDDNHRSSSEEVIAPGNVHSQRHQLNGIQKTTLTEVLKPANISQSEEVFGDKKMPPSKELVTPTDIHSPTDSHYDNQKSPSPLKEIPNPSPVSSNSVSNNLVCDEQTSSSKEVENSTVTNLLTDTFGDNRKSSLTEVQSPVNINLQSDKFNENQSSPSKEELNLRNKHSQEDLVGDTQKSPSKVVIPETLNNSSDELETSSSALDISVENSREDSLLSKSQRPVTRSKSDNTVILTTRLRRRAIKRDI